jgi:hypothetical protein
MVEGTNARQRPRLAFTKDDIDRLVATNRDFMWNDELHGARFQRIDGGQADPRWKPPDPKVRRIAARIFFATQRSHSYYLQTMLC